MTCDLVKLWKLPAPQSSLASSRIKGIGTWSGQVEEMNDVLSKTIDKYTRDSFIDGKVDPNKTLDELSTQIQNILVQVGIHVYVMDANNKRDGTMFANTNLQHETKIMLLDGNQRRHVVSFMKYIFEELYGKDEVSKCTTQGPLPLWVPNPIQDEICKHNFDEVACQEWTRLVTRHTSNSTLTTSL